jgi:hypothetical protein
MKREYEYCAAEFDCGCLQHSGISVDIYSTLKYYRAIASRNAHIVYDEVTSCKNNKIDGIVSDIPPFVFTIAELLDVPAIAVTNFTWYDIYQEYIAAYPEFISVLSEMKLQYQNADLLLALSPALPMNYFPTQHAAPVVGRCGKNCRSKLLNFYSISEKTKKIGLIYIGDFGLADAQWKRIESFSDWEFIGIQDIPEHPRNYHKIDFSCLSYPDIIASSDCVIGKLGYGVVSECMINATPLIFLPRKDFAEYPVLEKTVVQWGGGKKLSEEQFLQIDWNDALHTLPDKNDMIPVIGDGAKYCAGIIEEFIAHSIKP